MCKQLRSVGLDVGTSTTQLILSQLQVENEASGFAVPKMQITGRTILYQSPVELTPLLDESHVDGQKIREFVAREYERAGIDPKSVDTGAVIITGETSRKENAQAVLQEVSGFAGDFVVATAGPDLESVLAAKGAGAEEHSAKTGRRVLHMDIGGGTSNLALIENGTIVKTGCLNVGGRLIKRDAEGRVYYVSPVLQGLTDIAVGTVPTQTQLRQLMGMLVRALETAAGRAQDRELFEKLWTKESGAPWESVPADVMLSFSGGVAACMGSQTGTFGDIGPELARAIRESSLCQGDYLLPENAIRATVIGAGCHSARLSGSTVYCRDVTLPLKNLPVAVFSPQAQDREDLPELIRQRMAKAEGDGLVLGLAGFERPTYEQVAALAEKLLQGCGDRPVYVCLEADMAKALGQCISLRSRQPCLCLDGVALSEGCYLDVGAPVGPAYPVVVKTLVLSKQ